MEEQAGGCCAGLHAGSDSELSHSHRRTGGGEETRAPRELCLGGRASGLRDGEWGSGGGRQWVSNWWTPFLKPWAMKGKG